MNKMRYQIFKGRLLRDKWLYLFLIPFLLWYILFAYAPMYGLQIAFKDYNLFQGITESPWIGFEHFRDFFTGPYFWRLLFKHCYHQYDELGFCVSAVDCICLYVE